MRHFHLTRNAQWAPTINVEKLWTLVPKEQKDGLTESSDVVPVIDILQHGYGKVLGNGQCVYSRRCLNIERLTVVTRAGYRSCRSL
jgi:ribosomal protein L15